MIWCKLTHFNLVEESKGIEPYPVSRASRLAGGPYHHQGLLSLFVVSKGIEPYTSKRTHCFPGRPYHHQGLLTNCGENRARTCTPVSRYRFSRPGRYQLRFTSPSNLEESVGLEPTKVLPFTSFQN
jgi:hypothetical protein